jgi:glycosyltransferase involved in cell wall biosynthesis
MSSYRAYQVAHIWLDQLDHWPQFSAPALYYFWWHQRPLAHIWIDKNSSQSTIQTQVLEACSKAQGWNSAGIANWDALIGAIQCLDPLITQDQDQPVSIVICTRNRRDDLKKCLDQLMLSIQDTDEIIVVDNAPDNQSTALLLKEYPQVTYVLEPRKGLDIARNTGAKNASKNIIAYTDDDVQVAIDWVDNIRHAFDEPMTMAVTGLVVPQSLETRTQYVFERYWGFNRGYQKRVFDKAYFQVMLPYGVPVWDIGAGANMAFRKAAFELVGYFDERLDVGAAGCSGDSEFWYRILASGWNCVYQPMAVAYHEHRKEKKALSNQLYHYMRGNACSLLIQHEQWGHEGNLKRLYTYLPEYYWARIKERIKHGSKENFGSILTEMRGCIAGWRYYQQVKQQPRTTTLQIAPSLYKPVTITTNSLVSVIITAYNYGHYLEQAIHSVLQQTHAAREIIVIDDGSTDQTQDILANYPMVKSFRTNRVGLSWARNIGTVAAKGQFLVFLDADDYLLPDALEQNLQQFANKPQSAFVSGAHLRIDETDNFIPHPEAPYKFEDIYLSLLQGNYIAMEASVMYRRELFFHFHFNTELEACEDYELNLQIARHLPVFSHREFIAVYRIHKKNMSANQERMLKAAILVLEQQMSQTRNEAEKSALETGLANWKIHYQNNP